MEIKLDKPLIVLDIEATGDQINKDRIVEIGMIKTNPDGSEEVYEQRINPQIPIPLNVSEIHSIYDLDVKDSPTFKELANDIKTFIGDSCKRSLQVYGISKMSWKILKRIYNSFKTYWIISI